MQSLRNFSSPGTPWPTHNNPTDVGPPSAGGLTSFLPGNLLGSNAGVLLSVCGNMSASWAVSAAAELNNYTPLGTKRLVAYADFVIEKPTKELVEAINIKIQDNWDALASDHGLHLGSIKIFADWRCGGITPAATGSDSTEKHHAEWCLVKRREKDDEYDVVHADYVKLQIDKSIGKDSLYCPADTKFGVIRGKTLLELLSDKSFGEISVASNAAHQNALEARAVAQRKEALFEARSRAHAAFIAEQPTPEIVRSINSKIQENWRAIRSFRGWDVGGINITHRKGDDYQSYSSESDDDDSTLLAAEWCLHKMPTKGSLSSYELTYVGAVKHAISWSIQNENCSFLLDKADGVIRGQRLLDLLSKK